MPNKAVEVLYYLASQLATENENTSKWFSISGIPSNSDVDAAHNFFKDGQAAAKYHARTVSTGDKASAGLAMSYIGALGRSWQCRNVTPSRMYIHHLARCESQPDIVDRMRNYFNELVKLD